MRFADAGVVGRTTTAAIADAAGVTEPILYRHFSSKQGMFIAITRAMSGALQRTDPRCKNPPVSAEDAAALGQLGAIVKALGAASAPKP